MDTTAEIEPASLPGNYSARKNLRWNEAGAAADGPKASAKDQQSLASSSVTFSEESDAIHNNIPKTHISPAQMYSTESGHMFHAGSICIVLVGLPGRGKTNLSISLCRYLRWLGVRTQLFHLSDYRRKQMAQPEVEQQTNLEDKLFMNKIKQLALNDIVDYFKKDDGQIAIYDAINGSSNDRHQLALQLKENNIKCLFIESLIDDEALLSDNVRDSINSPDYANWGKAEALIDFRNKIKFAQQSYETINPNSNLSFIKSFNFGQKIEINKLKHDFLMTKIIFYILNTKIKSHSIYFARCSLNTINFKEDPPITEAAQNFVKKIYNTLCSDYPNDQLPHDLMIWTSTRLRTQQSAQIFKDTGLEVKHRPELTQLNPGKSESLSDDQLKKLFPEEYNRHQNDPYHHRYPRGESYHDLALKIEPLILEMEKLSNDILIICDETITRIFYGYLMAMNANDIPQMKFPKNEVIKVTYNAYGNVARRLKVEGVELDQV